MTAKLFCEPDASIEFRELLELAERHGLGEFCEVLMYGDCFTKKGRINKCAICRELGLKPKEFEQHYARLRALFNQEALEKRKPPNQKPQKPKWRMRVLKTQKFPNVGVQNPGTIVETTSQAYVDAWLRKGWAELIQGDERCWLRAPAITQR